MCIHAVTAHCVHCSVDAAAEAAAAQRLLTLGEDAQMASDGSVVMEIFVDR